MCGQIEEVSYGRCFKKARVPCSLNSFLQDGVHIQIYKYLLRVEINQTPRVAREIFKTRLSVSDIYSSI